MHIFKAVGVLLWIFNFSGGPAITDTRDKLSWLKLQEAESAFNKQRKPILVDLYTDWCGWCKVMDKKTYSDKNVVAYLQENFYPVKLNAETKESITFFGKSYSFNASYKANNIAVYFTQGNLSFPTTVIIPADGSAPQAIPGYLTPKEIEVLLKYFGEKKFGKVPFEEYRKQFKPSWN